MKREEWLKSEIKRLKKMREDFKSFPICEWEWRAKKAAETERQEQQAAKIENLKRDMEATSAIQTDSDTNKTTWTLKNLIAKAENFLSKAT